MPGALQSAPRCRESTCPPASNVNECVRSCMSIILYIYITLRCCRFLQEFIRTQQQNASPEVLLSIQSDLRTVNLSASLTAWCSAGVCVLEERSSGTPSKVPYKVCTCRHSHAHHTSPPVARALRGNGFEVSSARASERFSHGNSEPLSVILHQTEF